MFKFPSALKLEKQIKSTLIKAFKDLFYLKTQLFFTTNWLMKTKKLRRSNENSLLVNARQKILNASQKGITKYIFFGSRPVIIGDSYFSLSTEGVANEIITYMNDLHFVSIGFIDCDFNINSLYLFSNYTQVHIIFIIHFFILI